MQAAASGDISVLQELINVNTLAPIALFQAFHPLLKNSKDARYAVINTRAASSSTVKAGRMPFQSGFYGASKAASAHWVAKLSEEIKEEPIIVSSIHPGLVSSDMDRGAIKALGLDVDEVPKDFPVQPITPEISAQGIVKVLRGLKKEESGFLIDYKGERIEW